MLLQQLSPSFRELIMYNTMRAVIVFKQIEQALVNIMPSRSLNIGSAIYKDSLNIELQTHTRVIASKINYQL